MRETRKTDIPFECKTLMVLSKFQHQRDVKSNQAPLGFAPRRGQDHRTDKAKAFERKWLG